MAASSPRPTIGVVIAAAGESQRMNGIDKIWAPIADYPLIAYTVGHFEAADSIDEIALVVHPASFDRAQRLIHQLGWQKVTAVIGGVRRRDSVLSGTLALSPGLDYMIVHDGARPLVTPVIISASIIAVQHTGAASACVPLKDTVKYVDDQRNVIATPDRTQLRALQTPQIFRRDLLLMAHESIDNAIDVTDDATLVYSVGISVHLFAGSYPNLKVTTREDLESVSALWATQAMNI